MSANAHRTAKETLHEIDHVVRKYHRTMAAADAAQRSTEVADLADSVADLFEANAKYYRSRALVWRPAPPPSTAPEDITGEEC